MLLLILAAFLLGAAVFIALGTVSPAARTGQKAARIVSEWAGEERAARHLPRGNRFKPIEDVILRRLTSQTTRDRLRDRLAAAGVGASVTLGDFVLIRLGLILLGALGGALLGSTIGTSTMVFVFGATFAVAGYVIPGAMLDRRARARRDRIDDALPDALDLLAVTVEAGLGLYGAIVRLVESSPGPLADEFALSLAEMRVGESSSGALKRLAARIGSNEVRSMARTMIQGEELGFSLAKTLRGLADDVRRRRQAVAEERASKAPVKMLVPAALFIFPALFVVILGPAVLTLSSLLG
ncbi:MAG TPA: type II secretion system F family protein [Gaiellaceae bacterium]|nr:type II secretion system F family protein [Gaiellaceae bacterium]